MNDRAEDFYRRCELRGFPSPKRNTVLKEGSVVYVKGVKYYLGTDPVPTLEKAFKGTKKGEV